MKLCALLSIVFIFAACSSQPAAVNVIDVNKQAKNKQIAITNEVKQLMTLVQKLEKQGRGMEIYRQAGNAANLRECNRAMEDGQEEIKDFETRTGNLPDNYKSRLIPLTADLTVCVSCEKKALESCVKSRAAINQIIKEIFP